MSRSFSSTNNITQGTTALPTTGAISLWYYPTYSIGDSIWHEIFNITGSGGNLFHIAKYSDNNIYAGWYPNAEKRVITGAVAAGLTQNAWNHIYLEWTNNGDTKLYINNVQAGSTVANTTTWNTNTFTRIIGNNPTPFSQPATGRISEFSIHNVVLSVAERTALYEYKPANSIVTGPVDYLPLLGIYSPELNGAGGTAGTVTGATLAANPPMQYPLIRSISSIAYATRTNTTITAPAGIQDGDMLVLGFLIGASTPPTPTLPSGFSLRTGFPISSTTGGFTLTTRIATKIASGESGSYTVTHASASSQAFMLCISGTNGTVSASTINQSTGATTTVTGITTTYSNALPVFIGVSWDGYVGTGSVPSGTTPTYYELYDENEFYVAAGTMFSPGATGNDSNTSTNSGSNPNSGILLVFERPAISYVDGDGSSTIVFSTSAVGESLYSSVGNSTLVFSTSAVGGSLYSSVGNSTLVFSAIGTGSSVINGTVNSSLVFTCTAIGGSLVDSVGNSDIAFDVDASGNMAIDGNGEVTISFGTTAVGGSLYSSDGASTLEFGTEAIGSTYVDATGNSGISFSVTAFSGGEVRGRRSDSDRIGTRLPLWI